MEQQRNRLLLITPATTEPVTLTEVKDHLRIVDNLQDDHLLRLVAKAREYVEKITGRALVAQTWDYYTDHFPYSDFDCMRVPVPPLISVTSITYQDENNVTQTWASENYDVITYKQPFGEIRPKYNKVYPTTLVHPDSVKIRFVAGYAHSPVSPALSPPEEDLAENVPPTLKQAMLLLVGHMYENREAAMAAVVTLVVPMGVMSMIYPYRVFWS